MSEFLAEARVLIRPDTTAFRAQLLAELTAATRGVTATVPVTVATTGAAAARQVQREAVATVAAQEAVLTAAATKTAAASREIQTAQTAAARAAAKFALANAEVTNTTTSLATAQVQATRATAAVTAAQRSLDAALLAGNASLIQASRNTLALAEARQAETASALTAARAEAVHASSLGSVKQGALATGLSLFGIRGATLAASSAFLAGAAAAVLFARSVQSAARLEQELNVFRVTAGATADEMERVRQEAVALGRDISLPAVSAGDAAEAMTELAKAGLEVTDSIAGARGVLQLAAAAQISNAEATQLAASALNAFGLAGDQAVHVADLLANSANEAQGSISDMGIALAQSAAVGRLAGLSLEDVVALLTLLARNGLQGSDAGTSLRTALLRLINPTDRAAKVVRQLNVQLEDAQGNIRPEVFADFAEATEDLSARQRRTALAIIFGSDAIRAQAILGREGTAALDELSGALSRQGAAAELAGARAQGLTGSVSALSSNLETLGATLGGVVIPPLTLFVDTLNETVTGVTIAVDSVIGLAGALGDLNESLQEAVPGLNLVQDALGEFFLQQADPTRRFRQGIKLLADVFGDAGGQIRGDARETARDVRDLFAVFQETGGTVALNELVLALDEMAARLSRGDAEAQRLAAELREIRNEIQQFGGLPPTVIDIQARLDEDQVLAEAQKAGDKIVEGFALAGGAIREVGLELMRNLEEGLREGAEKISFATIPLSIERITGRFEEAILNAQLADDRRRQLDLLRREDAVIQEQLEAGVKRRDKRVALKAKQEQIQDEIAQIEGDIAADAKRAADEVADARREADDAIIDSIGLEESRLRNAVLAAQANESLLNDIRAQTALRNFYRRSIEEIRKTVEDAKRAAREIAALTADLLRADAELARLREEQKEAQRAERRQALERIQEGLELDLQIARATGNVAAQRRALNAEIEFYKERIRATRAGSNQRKRWILALREAQAELKELKDEAGKTGEFQQLTFEFLQAQQGFAANLLSNLIPTGATAGLVAGPQPPSITAVTPPVSPAPGITAAAGVAEARERGVTQGQFSVLIDLTRQMVRILGDGNRRREHPEARYQGAVGRAALDYFD